MNVSCDCQDPLSPITKKRIKTRTWYVEVMLEVILEVSDVTDDPDFDITQSVSKQFWTLLIRKEIYVLWLMLHPLTMQSTDGTEISSISPDSFMHVIKFGNVLWSPFDSRFPGALL